MQRVLVIVGIGAALAMGGMACATEFLASTFNRQPALGRPALIWDDVPHYAPWSVLAWTARWGQIYPKPFAIAQLFELAGVIGAIFAAIAAAPTRVAAKAFGKDAWATFADVLKAGLFASTGAVLGKLAGEILVYNGPGHQILIGASRSGKGRGHVVPTLFTWAGSALVLDVKGELDHGDRRQGFPGTSGYRALLGHVLRFAPTDPTSNCFNILFTVRRGANEVRDVQNIVDILVEPKGEAKGGERFWNDTAKIIVAGAILHVLYGEPLERKTLAVVREKLRDLDKTCDEMRRTLHRFNPKTGLAETHPEVLHAAQSYLAGEERLRSGVKATAESFFGIFADPMVAEKTSSSDFQIGDLVCADRPVTLYLQPPPSDAQRLMPLMRLFIAQVARSLMESQTHAADGREKKHLLLLMLDEFPQLGRIDFFEKMMGAMAGYGVKAYLVCQSLNHLIRAYGRENVILDNCAVVTTFAAADPETAKHIADMAGEVWEVRPFESEHRPRALFARKGTITYREERRPLLLPADVRGLRNDEELIFVAGAKPIRAKKLKFDAEPIFAERLLPPAPSSAGLSRDHDWTNVRALGMTAPQRKTVSSARSQRLHVEPPPLAQPELFAESVVATPPAAANGSSPSPPPQPTAPKISELALAGLRPTADQVEAAPTPALETSGAPATQRRARGTGV